ncbi:hypothetical protein DSLASN_18120 [Desulfoluna limicola]|uniref:Uncharacterized protein n=1 Tax=Desulfoluna limicola TaxID=2810562 RepID=A0ABM7PFT0_9BACT|nr:hypothetical protein DSLASN_18120 [Desulfoluna limicola]
MGGMRIFVQERRDEIGAPQPQGINLVQRLRLDKKLLSGIHKGIARNGCIGVVVVDPDTGSNGKPEAGSGLGRVRTGCLIVDAGCCRNCRTIFSDGDDADRTIGFNISTATAIRNVPIANPGLNIVRIY